MRVTLKNRDQIEFGLNFSSISIVIIMCSSSIRFSRALIPSTENLFCKLSNESALGAFIRYCSGIDNKVSPECTSCVARNPTLAMAVLITPN
jgi:hypothetical protein